MNDSLSINDVKVALSEVLKDNEHVELTVIKALNKYDLRLKEDIEKLCKKNVDIALGEHKYDCSGGKKDKKPYYLILALIVETIASKFGITK